MKNSRHAAPPALSPAVHVGTSGWQYGSWRGRFYPRELQQDAWLPYYASHFETVEVNNTFYRLPARETFVRWRNRTPAGFVVTVKASRYITHIKRLRDPTTAVRTFLERASGLGDKLGPVLFQLPPRFPADIERLAGFLAVLPRSLRAAFEFRDPSWATDEVHALLDDHGAALVLADSPGAKVPQIVTGGWSYIRFHKGQHLRPGYTKRKLQLWADRIATLPASEVFVYFNNDTDGAAVRDAPTLIGLLEERGHEIAFLPGSTSNAQRAAGGGSPRATA